MRHFFKINPTIEEEKESLLIKTSNPIDVPDRGLEIRHSKNKRLGLRRKSSKSGYHYYIVLLESLTSALIVLLGSMKKKYKYLIKDGRMRKITNTITPNKINPKTGKPYETVLQNEIKEIPNIPGNHIGYTDPKDNKKILDYLFNNKQQPEQSKLNQESTNTFKKKMNEQKNNKK